MPEPGIAGTGLYIWLADVRALVGPVEPSERGNSRECGPTLVVGEWSAIIDCTHAAAGPCINFSFKRGWVHLIEVGTPA